MGRVNEWLATASQDNAQAEATKAAVTGRRHIVARVFAGYSDGTTAGTLTVTRGSESFTAPVVGAAYLEPDLMAGAGEAVSATLTASGSAGVSGIVTILGRTE